MLKPQSQTQEFPKNIDFICINTSECKIGYMTFYDEDIDYLCKSGNENEYMKHFVKNILNTILIMLYNKAYCSAAIFFDWNNFKNPKGINHATISTKL